MDSISKVEDLATQALMDDIDNAGHDCDCHICIPETHKDDWDDDEEEWEDDDGEDWDDEDYDDLDDEDEDDEDDIWEEDGWDEH